MTFSYLAFQGSSNVVRIWKQTDYFNMLSFHISLSLYLHVHISSFTFRIPALSAFPSLFFIYHPKNQRLKKGFPKGEA